MFLFGLTSGFSFFSFLSDSAILGLGFDCSLRADLRTIVDNDLLCGGDQIISDLLTKLSSTKIN